MCMREEREVTGQGAGENVRPGRGREEEEGKEKKKKRRRSEIKTIRTRPPFRPNPFVVMSHRYGARQHKIHSMRPQTDTGKEGEVGAPISALELTYMTSVPRSQNTFVLSTILPLHPPT